MIVAVGEAANLAIAVRVTPHCQSAPGRLSPFHPPQLGRGLLFSRARPEQMLRWVRRPFDSTQRRWAMCPSLFVRVGWREIAQQDFAARDFSQDLWSPTIGLATVSVPKVSQRQGWARRNREWSQPSPPIQSTKSHPSSLSLADPIHLLQSVFGNGDRADLDKVSQWLAQRRQRPFWHPHFSQQDQRDVARSARRDPGGL